MEVDTTTPLPQPAGAPCTYHALPRPAHCCMSIALPYLAAAYCTGYNARFHILR